MPQIADDSHRVSIPSSPMGEIYELDFPATVKADEEWRGIFKYRNVGGSGGWFWAEFSGANITEIVFLDPHWLEPGENWGQEFWGRGPGDIPINLRFCKRGQGEHYHVDVGELPSARMATSIPKERSYGESLDVTVVPSVSPPEAALVNPRFPSAVGPDEEWWGTLELRNSGAREGHFFWDWSDLGEGYSGLWWIPADSLALFWIHWHGPIKFTIRWDVAEWTDVDTVVATIGQHTVAGAGGELRNLVISKEYVQDGEDWMGAVQIWNIGDAPGNFRVAFTGDITGTSQTFTLGPMEHAAVYFEDVSPKVFTITAQREVGAVWVVDDSRDAEAYNMITCLSNPIWISPILPHNGDYSRIIGGLQVGDHVFQRFVDPNTHYPHPIVYEVAEGKPYWTQLRYFGMPGRGYPSNVWPPQHNFPDPPPAARWRHPHPPE